MKRVYVSSDGGQHALVGSFIDAAGIPFETRHEAVAGVLPTAAFGPEIWVPEERFDEAQKLIAASLNSGASDSAE